MRRFNHLLLAGFCALALIPVMSAQDAKDDVKEAGKATKRAAKKTGAAVKDGTEDAAEATGHAAKKTGHKIKKGTKKVVHGAASETEEGAAKVKEKTQP
jgi:hypothetical protein